jgi:hypothetical protein
MTFEYNWLILLWHWIINIFKISILKIYFIRNNCVHWRFFFKFIQEHCTTLWIGINLITLLFIIMIMFNSLNISFVRKWMRGFTIIRWVSFCTVLRIKNISIILELQRQTRDSQFCFCIPVKHIRLPSARTTKFLFMWESNFNGANSSVFTVFRLVHGA